MTDSVGTQEASTGDSLEPGRRPKKDSRSKNASRPRLTVVVPTKNSSRTLERCLRSVAAQVTPDGSPYPVEIIVVDNHSTDGTGEIAVTHADLVSICGPERSAQRNRGTQLATGDFVLFVDSDMVLQPGVCAEIAAALDAPDCGGVIVPEESFGEGFWAKCRGLEKQIAIGDPRTEAARGFRVSELRELGGWNERLTAAEDWDLTDRVVATGKRIDRTTSRTLHDEGHPTLRANFQKKRYYGRWMASYVGGPVAAGTNRAARLSPLRIFRRPRLLLAAPHVSVGLLTLKTVDAIGVGLGVVAARRQVGHPGGIAAPR